jgi:hypothetical protein
MTVRMRIVGLLRHLRFLRADLLTRVAARMPINGEISNGELVIVASGGIQKWACMKCPGGCGTTITLSLNPERRPRWQVLRDWFGRPTLEPSVHQMTACRCHFWVRRGLVEWCADGHPRRPTA